MVLNSRSGSHQMLMRQLHQVAAQESVDNAQAAAAAAKISDDDEEEDEDEDEDAEEDEEAEDENGGGGEDDEQQQQAAAEDDEDEEEEDLFGQIASANPELLLPAAAQIGRSQGFGRDDWGDGATLALLQAWGDKCTQLNKWHLRRQHWAELAAAVTSRSSSSKTDVQCKNRVDTLKKKFKHEKLKQASIGTPSKWAFYRILDRLLSMANSSKNNNCNNLRKGVLPCSADAGNIVRAFKRGKTKNSSTSSSEEEELAEDRVQEDSWGCGGEKRKKKRRRKSCSSSSSSLTGAIAKLGEIFERIEECKRQQLVDLEKIRMQFTRDLELHRMQLLMQTQMELAKIKHSCSSSGINDLDS